MQLYRPEIEVILYPIVSKLDTSVKIGKEDKGAFDIVEFFGDNCVISVSKGILEPAGSFSITFLDIAAENGSDASSIYSLVRPMDGIEIRAAHDGSQETKTLMRGFVSRVSREESMSEDGTPVRRVTIQGEDVGKIWLTQYLYFLPTAQDSVLMLDGYGFQSKYFGNVNKNMSGEQFVRIVGGILDENIKNLTLETDMNLSLTFAAEGEGEVAIQLLQGTADISIYQFMASMLDVGAFFELWIDDPGDGPAILRWRPLWSGPDGETISNDDIVSFSVSRDDSRVSNWYFCYPRAGVLTTQFDQLAMARRAGDLCNGREDLWSQEKHYGWRKMEVEFALRPPSYPANNDAPTVAQYNAGVISDTEWIQQRIRLLRELNQNNASLENCTITMCGNEDLRPGTWVTVEKGSETFEYYAVSVEHTIHLYHSFRTTLHGQRGEKISGQNTYFEEIDAKGALK